MADYWLGQSGTDLVPRTIAVIELMIAMAMLCLEDGVL